jgi:Arc/MetJ-type ribon-helix-helix transcriptional regulator
MGRPPLNVRATQVRLTEDVRRRIQALVGAHRMSAFIREAIENELRRREKLVGKPSQDTAAEQAVLLVGQQSPD